MPIVTTLHTVLSAPNPAQRAVLEELARLSERLVVMSTSGADLLMRVHGISSDQIDLIPHGIPHVPVDAASKDRLGVEGKTVILTFGLLSRDKGICTTGRRTPASRWRPAASRNSSIGWMGMAQRRSHAAKHVTAPRALAGSWPPSTCGRSSTRLASHAGLCVYARASVVFAQGGPANSVFYIQHGGVKLSVVSRRGREAIVAMLGLAISSAKAAWPDNRSASAQPRRWRHDRAADQKAEMMRTLHDEPRCRIASSRTCSPATSGSRKTSSISSSTRARSGWRVPCSSWHAMATSGGHSACSRRSRRKRSPRWSAPPGRASTSS